MSNYDQEDFDGLQDPPNVPYEDTYAGKKELRSNTTMKIVAVCTILFLVVFGLSELVKWIIN